MAGPGAPPPTGLGGEVQRPVVVAAPLESSPISPTAETDAAGEPVLAAIPAESPAADAPPREVPVADAPAAEVPVADVLAADAPAADIPAVIPQEVPVPGEQDAAPPVATDPALQEKTDELSADAEAADDAPVEAKAPARRTRRSTGEGSAPETST